MVVPWIVGHNYTSTCVTTYDVKINKKQINNAHLIISILYIIIISVKIAEINGLCRL